MPGWKKHKPESKLQGDRFMDMGRGEMHGKSNIEAYITICKTDSQQEFAVRLRNSNRGSVST